MANIRGQSGVAYMYSYTQRESPSCAPSILGGLSSHTRISHLISFYHGLSEPSKNAIMGARSGPVDFQLAAGIATLALKAPFSFSASGHISVGS